MFIYELNLLELIRLNLIDNQNRLSDKDLEHKSRVYKRSNVSKHNLNPNKT